MTGDKTAVALAETRERMAECKDGFSSDPGAYIRSAGDVPRLLAAVEAALNFHEPVNDGHALAECSSCLGAYGDRAEWPCDEYKALLAALTGKGGTDG